MTEETKAAIRECVRLTDEHPCKSPACLASAILRSHFPEAWEPAPPQEATPGIPSWDWDKHPEGRQRLQLTGEGEDTIRNTERLNAWLDAMVANVERQRHERNQPEPFPLPMGC